MDKYIPDIYQKSIYTVDYKELYNHGIRCVLFDINNTLVPSSSNDISEDLKKLIKEIKNIGIEPIIYANCNSRRVNMFKDSLQIDGYSFAHMWFTNKINNILSKYKEPEIAIIGDQMMTDIRYGNEEGITTILVNPISNKDCFLSLSNRGKERRIMSKLRNNNLFVKGRYYG